MIKLMILLLLISQSAFADLSTPRDAMKTFLQSMVEIKKQNKDEEKYYKKAIDLLGTKEQSKE